jgi:uncharacterized protein YndB with AHSA1/START domain
MTDKPKELKFRLDIEASPAEVFAAFTSASALCEWLCAVADAEPHKGGRIYLWWNNGYYASGEYLVLKYPEKIAFTWHGRNEPGQSQVRINLKSTPQGTQLTLLHSGLMDGKPWKSTIKAIRKGWKSNLPNLKSVVETGKDQRVLNRPLLGISGASEYFSDGANAGGKTKSKGILINDLLDGLGAQQAGLQPGDVILRIGRQKVTSLSMLASIMQGKIAGDTLLLTCLRNGEKFTTQVTLSARQFPEVPETTEKLATGLQARYETFQQKLNDALAGVSEELSRFRPDKQQWNIREILAHLIAAERELHIRISALMDGQDFPAFFATGHHARTEAIQAALQTLPGLQQQLAAHQAETIALVNALPIEFVARKGSYWRLGITLLENPAHQEEHLTQIQAILELAPALSDQPAHHPDESPVIGVPSDGKEAGT